MEFLEWRSSSLMVVGIDNRLMSGSDTMGVDLSLCSIGEKTKLLSADPLRSLPKLLPVWFVLQDEEKFGQAHQLCVRIYEREQVAVVSLKL